MGRIRYPQARQEHTMTTYHRILAAGALLLALTGAAHPAGEKKALKVCLISGSAEYESDKSLAKLQQYLEKNHAVTCSRAFATSDTDLPGLQALDDCDVAVLFTRRLKLQGEQLERLKKYCQSGRPLVGIRTASHAIQTWLDLDREVLGGNYKNHYNAGPVCEVKLTEEAKGHPILRGVKPFQSVGSLYKNTGLAKDVTVLLTGSIPEHTEPIAWTRMHNGGRVFYTSLGHQKDFDNDDFVRLITNALYWAAQRAPAGK
jgi:type 1 glutamine amidotransferase